MLRRNRLQYKKYKEQARAVVRARLAFHNSFYNLPLRKVFIKSLKSRWGSCSERGNLNFNYLLFFLPPPVQDYLIVHELCHLQEFNHSPAFWALVSKTVPNYRAARQELHRLERAQVFSGRNKRFTKVDTKTGKFIDQMSHKGKPFKGIKIK